MFDALRRADTALPRLAFVHSAHSFPTLEIVEASRGVCELIWVIDSREPGIGNLPRLLERTGPVVDIAGQSPAAAAEAIASERPAGILTLADKFIEQTAAIAEAIGLPFLSTRTPRPRRTSPGYDSSSWTSWTRTTSRPSGACSTRSRTA